MQPELGNTVTISFGNILKNKYYLSKYRIRFYHKNRIFSTSTPIESVLCSDLYSEQIEKELNGTSDSKQFVDAFSEKGQSYSIWVCPNLTEY